MVTHVVSNLTVTFTVLSTGTERGSELEIVSYRIVYNFTSYTRNFLKTSAVMCAQQSIFIFVF